MLVDGTRWRVLRRSGDLDPALLADRPVEERGQTRWSVTWAVPLTDGLPAELPGSVARVFRAPTATDDPLSLPAVLAASLPLGPDRRRIQLGPLAQAVLREAADGLAELLLELPLDPSRLALVPPPIAAGEVDATLGSLVLQAFSRTSVLGHRAPVVLEGANPALVELLEDVVDGLLPHLWSAHRWSAALRRLGVRRVSLAELTELLAGLDRPASWWGRLYAALPPDLEQLGALPVPLTDGSLAASPRGLLVSDASVDLSPLGFRVVAPDARHDLLLRLGAQHAEPRALLDDPRVRAAVDRVADEEGWDEQQVVEGVLALVGGADLSPGDLPWLSELPLPTTDGDIRPAGELVLPGSPLASVLDLEAGFGVVAEGVAHPDVLAAVGVLRDVVEVPFEEAGDVDGLDAWLATLAPGEEPGPVVRDLDLVRPDAWPRALELLEPHLTSYVVHWLSQHEVLDGRRPDTLLLKGSDPLLVGLLDETGHPLAARLGAVSSLHQIPPALLLERLADPDREVARSQLRALHAHLSALTAPLPDRVRTAAGVVAAEDAVVVDRPDLLPRVAPFVVVPVPLAQAHALADALDLALASDVVPTAELAGEPTPWGEAPGGFVEHDALSVPTAGGGQVDVDWVAVGAVDHVVGPEGKAKALAWRLGDWPLRHALLARFLQTGDDAETDLDPV